jgi:hypothetical protein
MAEPDTLTKLAARGGQRLPASAWSAIIDRVGSTALTSAVAVPAQVVADQVAQGCSATVAKALIERCDDPATIALFAADGRQSVLSRLARCWRWSDDMVAAAIDADLDAATVLCLLRQPVRLDLRRRLWAKTGFDTAVTDAALRAEVLDADTVAELLCRDDAVRAPNVDVAVAALVAATGAAALLVGDEHLAPEATPGIAATRLERQVAEALLARIERRAFTGDVTPTYVAAAVLADNPSLPVELRRRALRAATVDGNTSHWEWPVVIDAVPYVEHPDAWDDRAAAAVLSRGSDPRTEHRVVMLAELAVAAGLSDELREIAAHRCAATIDTGWHLWFASQVHDMVKDCGSVDVHWEDRIRTRRRQIDPACVTGVDVAERLGNPDRTVIIASEEHQLRVAQQRWVDVRDHEMATVAEYLACRVGDDAASWRLLVELAEGFTGTVVELADLVSSALD